MTSATVTVAGLHSDELRWVRLLVDLLRHEDPTVPELACQALLYLAGAKKLAGLYQNNQEKG